METHESVKWGVYIAGSNKTLAAFDFENAVNKCKDINKSILMAVSMKSFFNSPIPIIYANLIIWSDENGDHEPDKTNWDDLTNP